MNRRAFVRLLGGSVAGLAGCSALRPTDSDGDGVPDADDYAPRDPDVSRKSDLNRTETGPTGICKATSLCETPTPNQSRVSSPTRPPTSREVNALSVAPGDFPGVSHITSYSSNRVSVFVAPETYPGDLSRRKVGVVAATYPRAEVVGRFESPFPVSEEADTSYRVSTSLADAPRSRLLQYIAFLLPASASIEGVSLGDVAVLHETDPFRLAADGTVSRASPPEFRKLTDYAVDGYRRTPKEGVLDVTVTGRTNRRDWRVNFWVFKSAYVAASRTDRGWDYSALVGREQTSGFADELATLLHDEARAQGFSDKQQQVEFAVDFVQRLPYVPDDVSTGYDDYSKFSVETLAEGGGDCEDTSVMLAGVLQASPFEYDTVLIAPPHHVAIGIYGAETLPGYYWELDGRRYYYVETTGEGWGIGELPDEYRGVDARVIQV